MFDESADFIRLILEPDFSKDETIGIEYSIKNDLAPSLTKRYIISFSNPDLLIWLYNNDFDLTEPLNQLRYDYTEIDETNSVLFEYAMNTNRIISSYSVLENDESVGPMDSYLMKSRGLDQIKGLQKELINKL